MFPTFAQKKSSVNKNKTVLWAKKKFELISCIEIFISFNLLYIIEVFSHQGSTILFSFEGSEQASLAKESGERTTQIK